MAEAFPENMISMQAEVREFRGSKEKRGCGEFTGRRLGKYKVRVVCRAGIRPIQHRAKIRFHVKSRTKLEIAQSIRVLALL